MSKPSEIEWAKARLKKLLPGKTSRFGDANLESLIALIASLDEIRGQFGLHQVFGPRVGIFFTVALLIPVCLGWLFDIPGIIGGLGFSVALGYFWRTYRSLHTSKMIHLGGAKGYAGSQRLTDKHRFGGTLQHQVNRMRPTFTIHYFLHSDSDSSRLSWRPFALAALIIIALIWFPVIGIALMTFLVAFVLYAYSNSRAPVALYLGPSTLDAIKLFWRIRYGTGIPWASLLQDPVDLPAEADGSIEQQIDVLANFIYSNPWSLRWDANDDWHAIVLDFIAASTVIVIKAADVPAVLCELDLLRTAHPLERIIVIADETLRRTLLPSELTPAVMQEADAMEFLSLIASQPRAFKRQMHARAVHFPSDQTAECIGSEIECSRMG